MRFSLGSRGARPRDDEPSLPARAADEVDDLCVQAANDALMAILSKLATYRGSARFTTWACKFVILEASARLRRHAWRERKVELDDTIWDRLPDRAPPILKRLEDDQLIVEHSTAPSTRT